MNHADDLLDSIDEALFELSFDLSILYLNKKAELTWQIKRQKVLNSNISDSLIAYFGQQGAESIQSALIHKEKTFGSYYFRSQKKRFFFSVNPLKSSLLLTFFDERPPGYKESEDKYWCLKQLEPGVAIGGFERFFSQQKVHWSDELYRIHGLSPQSEEITVSRMMEFLHPDEDEEVKAYLLSLHEHGKPISCIHRIITADGFTRLVHRVAEVVTDNEGKPWKILGTVRDISDLKDIEEEIRSRDRFLQDAEAMGYTGSYEGDFETMSLRFSEGLYKLFGYEANGFRPTMDFIDSVSHPEDIEVVSNIIETAKVSGQPYEYIRRIFRPDGEMRYLFSKGRIVHDRSGTPKKFLGTVHDITEQKIAEEETIRNRNLLQAVFDASTLPITLFETIYNEKGEVIDFLFVLENEVSIKLWKNGRIGESLLGLNPGIQGTPIFELYKNVVETGVRLVSELHLNGDWIKGWFRLTAVKRDKFLIATIENISERKLTENSLKKSLHVLTQAEAIVNMGSWEYNVVDKTSWWSNGMYRIFSSLSKPLSPEVYMELVIPENRDIRDRIIDCMERTYKSFDEIFAVEINNERKVIQVKGSPLVNENGEVEAMIGINKDVTEKVKAELELKRQSHFIQQIAEASPDLIAVIQVEPMAVTYVNSNIYEYIGYSTKEITQLNQDQIYEIIHPNDLSVLVEYISAFSLAKDYEIRELEFRVRNRSHNWVCLKSRTKVFQRNSEGRVTHLISVTQDITDKKFVQRELDRQNHLVQKIAQATPDIIVIFDLLKNSLVYINKELYPILGITSKEFLKMGYEEWEKIVCKDDLPLIKDYLDDFSTVQKFKVGEVVYRIKRADGKWWWVRARGKVFKRNLEGEPTQIVSVIQDYGPKKEAEEKIRENEFMQALLQKKDEFMSVASHELKTPITSIKASLQILQRQIEKHVDESVLLVFVTKAIVQINKLTTLIADLMDNTKIQAGKLQLNISSCTIDEIISDTIMHGFDERQIIVENNVHEPVEVDRIRIEQVLTNFLTNAIKYSPGSKRIVLRANQEGNFVRVEVQDFGIGIAREKLGFVFDRFFRADESSTQFSGLGLGLYISSEIIKQHYGEFGVESEEGKGSTFWFKIPFKHENPGEML